MKKLSLDSLEQINGGWKVSEVAGVIAGACGGYSVGRFLFQRLLQVAVPPLGAAVTVACVTATVVSATGW